MAETRFAGIAMLMLLTAVLSGCNKASDATLGRAQVRELPPVYVPAEASPMDMPVWYRDLLQKERSGNKPVAVIRPSRTVTESRAAVKGVPANRTTGRSFVRGYW